eukprot:7903817-Pyramimonas_sp.AAC.1
MAGGCGPDAEGGAARAESRAGLHRRQHGPLQVRVLNQPTTVDRCPPRSIDGRCSRSARRPYRGRSFKYKSDGALGFCEGSALNRAGDEAYD